MAKSDRSKSARERAAEMRAEQAKADKRRNRLWVGGVVVLVLILIGVLVAIGLTHKTPSKPSAATTTADPSVLKQVFTVPQTTLDTVGAGSVVNPPKSIGTSVTMTADGKPRILYVGAEFCPYCAAERWAVVQALSRFGTWKGLGATASSSSDVYPSTSTFTFHGATFTSPYLSFTGVEQETNVSNGSGGYTSLDKLSKSDAAILAKYDAPPYVDKASTGSIPFINFAGMWLISGSTYSPQVLQGLTPVQIAAQMRIPTTDVSKGILGSANTITAAICSTTKNMPASVCDTTAVTTAAQKLSVS